jgi:hypothetical protein
VIEPAAAAVPVAGNPFAFDDGNATMLMFDAEWCGTDCIHQKEIMRVVANEFRGDVYVNFADVDTPGNEFLLMEYQVSTVPFIVILNDQGEAIGGFAGVTAPANLYQAVAAALRESTGSSLPDRDA